MQDPLRQALAKLAAAEERVYIDDASDGDAAERYYAGVDPDADPAALFSVLSALLTQTHRARPEFRPSVELYPWIDLQHDGKLRSVYTQEEFDARGVIEEAAEIEARRRAFRAARRAERSSDDQALEAQVEREEPYNCEHTVPQGWVDHHEPMRGDLHHLFTCDAPATTSAPTRPLPTTRISSPKYGSVAEPPRPRASSLGPGRARRPRDPAGLPEQGRE